MVKVEHARQLRKFFVYRMERSCQAKPFYRLVQTLLTLGLVEDAFATLTPYFLAPISTYKRA